MEDRITPGLWFETTNGDAAAYAATRVPEVLHQPGALAASWWENQVPDRTDLPRTLDEFTLLGVYEVSLEFRPPTLPEGVGGHLFHHYRRPGQGCLTGRRTRGLSLVLISPRHEEGAQALRDWADFVHIRHIADAGVPGFTMITPYENADGGEPRFCHFYELDTDDPEAAFQEMPRIVADRLGPGSEAFVEWTRHPELRIDYVNSFRLLGTSVP
jgi:hypothetical protein